MAIKLLNKVGAAVVVVIVAGSVWVGGMLERGKEKKSWLTPDIPKSM